MNIPIIHGLFLWNRCFALPLQIPICMMQTGLCKKRAKRNGIPGKFIYFITPFFLSCMYILEAVVTLAIKMKMRSCTCTTTNMKWKGNDDDGRFSMLDDPFKPLVCLQMVFITTSFFLIFRNSELNFRRVPPPHSIGIPLPPTTWNKNHYCITVYRTAQ